MDVEQVRTEDDTAALWQVLRQARADGDATLVREVERRMRTLGDARRTDQSEARTASHRRRTRREAAWTLVLSLVAFVVTVVTGGLVFGFSAVVLAAAGFAALFTGAVMLTAIQPNRPYHPDAGSENRGFNYVRGEGGSG